MSPLPSAPRFEYRTHARWAVLLFGVGFAALGVRFFQLQVVHGHTYEQLSQVQQIGRARIPARRGEIRDRAGRVLARNVPTHEAWLLPGRVRDPDGAVALLRQLLALTDDEVEGLTREITEARGSDRFERVTVRRDLVGDRCPHDNNRLELTDEPHHQLWCPRCGRDFEPWSRGQRRCVIDGGRLLVAGEGRHAHCRTCGLEYLKEEVCPYDGHRLQARQASLRCRTCGRRYNDEVAMLKARRSELRGVEVTTEFRRDYPYGRRTAIPVGYVNEVNREEVRADPKVYRPGDGIGRRGLERALEKDLRGRSGEYVFLRRKQSITRADQHLLDVLKGYEPRQAVAGHHVILTLDVEIQEVLIEALADGHRAGAAVVIDPNTGAILGLASHPTYDPNHWAGRLTRAIKQSYDRNEYSPMLDRTTAAYPPASVFKIVTALAGLDSGLVAAKDRVDCGGYYEFAGRRFRCHLRTGHGGTDLVEAMAESCDVYFYLLGEQLRIEGLHHYAKTIFRLGEPTGIEYRETAGWIPSRERYFQRREGVRFKPGWTLSIAVGQGNVLTSPLQVARLLASIAADGAIPRLYLVDEVIDAQGDRVRRTRPEVVDTLPFSQEHMALIQRSLRDVIAGRTGTARGIAMEDLTLAGKTGTAEAREYRKGASEDFKEWLQRDHAWFAGYAPAERPEVVVVVLLEHGGSGGAHAAPVFRRIVEALFDRRLNLPPGGRP